MVGASQDGTSKPSTPINWKAARAAERMQGLAGRALFKEPSATTGCLALIMERLSAQLAQKAE